jgi:ribonucleotide monophosphatase NagD (HAD superfamily)
MSHADAFDGFAIDLDGVVWLAGAPIAGSVDAVAELRRAGHPVEPPMFEAAKRRLGGDRMAMVGDTLDADIAGGQAAGLATILVLSGRTSREDAEGATIHPDVVLPDLAALCS